MEPKSGELVSQIPWNSNGIAADGRGIWNASGTSAEGEGRSKLSSCKSTRKLRAQRVGFKLGHASVKSPRKLMAKEVEPQLIGHGRSHSKVSINISMPIEIV
jgi:hypothetical protein